MVPLVISEVCFDVPIPHRVFTPPAHRCSYMCSQALAMSFVLLEGGHFVCKVFEISSPEMVHLLARLSCMFESIALIKPITSRPASSERYLVSEYTQHSARA
jgi:cap1 methyltransferase